MNLLSSLVVYRKSRRSASPERQRDRYNTVARNFDSETLAASQQYKPYSVLEQRHRLDIDKFPMFLASCT